MSSLPPSKHGSGSRLSGLGRRSHHTHSDVIQDNERSLSGGSHSQLADIRFYAPLRPRAESSPFGAPLSSSNHKTPVRSYYQHSLDGSLSEFPHRKDLGVRTNPYQLQQMLHIVHRRQSAKTLQSWLRGHCLRWHPPIVNLLLIGTPVLGPPEDLRTQNCTQPNFPTKTVSLRTTTIFTLTTQSRKSLSRFLQKTDLLHEDHLASLFLQR